MNCSGAQQDQRQIGRKKRILYRHLLRGMAGARRDAALILANLKRILWETMGLVGFEPKALRIRINRAGKDHAKPAISLPLPDQRRCVPFRKGKGVDDRVPTVTYQTVPYVSVRLLHAQR
jgi:hypothetical protein